MAAPGESGGVDASSDETSTPPLVSLGPVYFTRMSSYSCVPMPIISAWSMQDFQ